MPDSTELIVHPFTGQAIAVAAPTTELAEAWRELDAAYDALADYKAAIRGELVRRLDARGTRSAEVGDVKLTTNAPTEDVYDVEALRAALTKLADEGVIERELIDEVVKTPPPKPEPPKVDKRKANALLKSDNRAVVAAIAGARSRVNTNRTIKVEGGA